MSVTGEKKRKEKKQENMDACSQKEENRINNRWGCVRARVQGLHSGSEWCISWGYV